MTHTSHTRINLKIYTIIQSPEELSENRSFITCQQQDRLVQCFQEVNLAMGLKCSDSKNMFLRMYVKKIKQGRLTDKGVHNNII